MSVSCSNSNTFTLKIDFKKHSFFKRNNSVFLLTSYFFCTSTTVSAKIICIFFTVITETLKQNCLLCKMWFQWRFAPQNKFIFSSFLVPCISLLKVSPVWAKFRVVGLVNRDLNTRKLVMFRISNKTTNTFPCNAN